MRVVWSALAEERTAEAFAYIAADRPSAAARWLSRVLASVEALTRNPDRGRAVPELGRPDIRELIIRPYRVMYRREPNRVVILTVRHARRDFEKEEILKEE